MDNKDDNQENKVVIEFRRSELEIPTLPVTQKLIDEEFAKRRSSRIAPNKEKKSTPSQKKFGFRRIGTAIFAALLLYLFGQVIEAVGNYQYTNLFSEDLATLTPSDVLGAAKDWNVYASKLNLLIEISKGLAIASVLYSIFVVLKHTINPNGPPRNDTR